MITANTPTLPDHVKIVDSFQDGWPVWVLYINDEPQDTWYRKTDEEPNGLTKNEMEQKKFHI